MPKRNKKKPRTWDAVGAGGREYPAVQTGPRPYLKVDDTVVSLLALLDVAACRLPSSSSGPPAPAVSSGMFRRGEHSGVRLVRYCVCSFASFLKCIALRCASLIFLRLRLLSHARRASFYPTRFAHLGSEGRTGQFPSHDFIC